MTPNVTVGYMAEQINRRRLDGVVARNSLADQVATKRSRAAGAAQAPVLLGAALARLGERMKGTVRPAGTLADPAPLPAWSTR